MTLTSNGKKPRRQKVALPQIKTALNYRGYWISQSVAKLVNQSEEEAPQKNPHRFPSHRGNAVAPK